MSLRNQSTNRITYSCHLQLSMKQKQSRSTFRKVENVKSNHIYYKRTYNSESLMPRVFLTESHMLSYELHTTNLFNPSQRLR